MALEFAYSITKLFHSEKPEVIAQFKEMRVIPNNKVVGEKRMTGNRGLRRRRSTCACYTSQGCLNFLCSKNPKGNKRR
jgi:hypothetical protein